MNKKNNYNIDLKDLEIRHSKLIEKITPDEKLMCVGFYHGPLNKINFDISNEFNCNIIEIITDPLIDIETFKELIEEAEYRILDMTHSTNQLHFLIQKFE